MREVQIYIEGQRLELFNDEIIQITSSVQNVQDIAKVFTDFSQSFTVPASEHNNQIFQHFYESAVDGTLDYQLRRSSKIEIDLVPFRTGKIQIEKSNLVKGRVESYTITFYGDVRTLQDYFNEDKLSSLDLTPYTHTYSGTQIKARIKNTNDYDVRWPLISSERVWTYGDNANTDISQNSHHMHYDELFPALKIRRIFEAIETKYSIDFQGAFLTDNRFDKAFLYLKNKESLENFSPTYDIDFNYTDNPTNFNISNDTLTVQTLNIIGATHKIEIRTQASFSGATDYIDIYKNGSLLTTLSTNGDTILLSEFDDAPGINDVYNFKIRASNVVGTLNYQFFVYYTITIPATNTILMTYANTDIFGGSITGGTLSLSENVPDITVSDFIKGVLKEFNLTISPLSSTAFELLPLEDWYAKGAIVDITKFTDIDNIDVERIKLYKQILFKYQSSESFLNKKFKEFYGREYGDLEQTYNYDGSDYVVEVPFENLLFNKFTGTDLQVGYCLDDNYNHYIPKPILLYLDQQKSCSFYFNDGSVTEAINVYMAMGQETYSNSQYYTLNFGPEISSLYETVITNDLFKTYYSNYLNNLYVKKNRLYYVKTYLPVTILATLRLNDRLIIRDKRYIINEMKSNLNTGQVDFVLMLDFRPLRVTKVPKFPKGLGTTKSTFLLPNKCVQIDIDTGLTGVTASPATLTQDGDVTFSITPLTEHYTLIAENSDDLITDFYAYIRSEELNTVSYEITITYTYEDGSTEIEIFTITAET